MSGLVNLAQMRQHYRAALVDSEEQAQRLMSLGVGAAAAVLVMTAPALSPALHMVWVGLFAAVMAGGFLLRRRIYEQLRQTLLEQQLTMHTPLDMELWHRIGRLPLLPQPLNDYVEHFLTTYRDLKARVRSGDRVELGQVQVIEAREHVHDFLDLAERTGEIRNVLESQSHRLSDEDQIRLRQRFNEQCGGLHEIMQSFDRSVGNLAVAQVLTDDLGEATIEDVAQRMRSIEEEFDEVKQSLSVSGP